MYLTEKAAYDLRVLEATKKAEQQPAEVDAFEQGYRAGVPEQVAFYNELLLTTSQYPDGFIAQMKVGYVADSRQLVIEYELPTTAVIPP